MSGDGKTGPRELARLVHDEFDPRARLMPVLGDGMAPTFADGDVVAVRPVDDFDGDGVYVLASPTIDGGPELRSCDRSVARSDIRLMLDNPRYRNVEHVPREWFREHVIGRVVAVCRRVP